jgi:hypothetical protein
MTKTQKILVVVGISLVVATVIILIARANKKKKEDLNNQVVETVEENESERILVSSEPQSRPVNDLDISPETKQRLAVALN